jgi:cyclase
MRFKRVIPILLLKGKSLVKTNGFNNPQYIGDPCNTLRIFNELEVDEIVILDIGASQSGSGPNFQLMEDIASECFMPISYGGGITNIEQANKLFSLGIEKIVFNNACFEDLSLMQSVSNKFGSQAVVASIDFRVRRNDEIKAVNHKNKREINAFNHLVSVESSGAGEIILTNIAREGSWQGYDLDSLRTLSRNVDLPIIANGGCGSPDHIETLFSDTQISAAGVGSMFVYQQKGMGVLVNIPESIRRR